LSAVVPGALTREDSTDRARTDSMAEPDDFTSDVARCPQRGVLLGKPDDQLSDLVADQ